MHQYRGHTITFRIQQSPATLHWQTRGVIEFTEGETLRSVTVSGTIDAFTTEAEAKHCFLQQAKKWIDDRLVSEEYDKISFGSPVAAEKSG